MSTSHSAPEGATHVPRSISDALRHATRASQSGAISSKQRAHPSNVDRAHSIEVADFLLRDRQAGSRVRRERAVTISRRRIIVISVLALCAAVPWLVAATRPASDTSRPSSVTTSDDRIDASDPAPPQPQVGLIAGTAAPVRTPRHRRSTIHTSAPRAHRHDHSQVQRATPAAPPLSASPAVAAPTGASHTLPPAPARPASATPPSDESIELVPIR